MNIKRFQFNSGESYSILLDDDLLPMYYPNLFVTLYHRNRSDTANTCYKEFEHIKLFYEIMDILDIDIENRCKRGVFLERNEVEGITGLAKYHSAILKEVNFTFLNNSLKKKKPSPGKIEGARFYPVINKENLVSSKTCYNRLTTFANYIGWLENMLFHSTQADTKHLFIVLRPKRKERINIIDNHAVKVVDLLDKNGVKIPLENSDYNYDYRSLSENQLAQIFEVVKVENNRNPWQRSDVRFRNQLLIHLLSSTGMRRGEVIRIKITDLGRSTTTGRYYLLVRVGEDMEDKRINKPSAKTSGRRVPLHQNLYHMIEEYIIFHRSKITNVEKTPYLLVAHSSGRNQKGDNGLSLVSVNKICLQISVVVGFTVHPHMFRHTWNDRFSKHVENLIREGKTTEAKAESDRRKLMGWSSESEMGARYARKYEEERAIKTGLKLQDKSYNQEDDSQ